MIDEETKAILHKKINLFYKSKQFIHIKIKNGTFYNGYIKEISADFFMFEDRKSGLLPVFLLEIEDMEPFRGEINDSKLY